MKFVLPLLLFTVTPTFAQLNSISLGVGLGTSFFKSSNYSISYVGLNQNIGLYASDQLNNKWFFEGGIQFGLLSAGNYRNTVTYASNWSGGIEYTNVRLKTSINQTSLEFPFTANYSLSNHIQVGAGMMFSFLTTSTFNQKVEGYYFIDKYPNEHAILNRAIQFDLNMEDKTSTAYFSKTNFWPLVRVGYTANKLSLFALCTASVISTPKEYWLFSSFTEIRPQILITYKFKNYEKQN